MDAIIGSGAKSMVPDSILTLSKKSGAGGERYHLEINTRSFPGRDVVLEYIETEKRFRTCSVQQDGGNRAGPSDMLLQRLFSAWENDINATRSRSECETRWSVTRTRAGGIISALMNAGFIIQQGSGNRVRYQLTDAGRTAISSATSRRY